MNVRKAGFMVLSIAVGLGILAMAVVGHWKQTPYGTLHVNAALLLKVIAFRKIDLFGENKSPREIREISAASRGALQKRPTPVENIRDTTFPGPAGPVPIRIYTPVQQARRPVIIYYHGGGWVMGDLDSHDNICRSLAKKTGGIVVSVGYRLAPEYPFPAAVDDAYAALGWVSEKALFLGGDPAHIVTAGDSAGANLAAAIGLAARDRNGPSICGQVLAYPVTDLSTFDRPSYRDFSQGYYLTRLYMEEFRKRYLPNIEDRFNPHASPLLASNLGNLPPTLVITAGFDVLRDEGEAFAERLRVAGVPVVASHYPGMIHGFLSMDRLFPQAGRATDEIADFVNRLTP